MNRITSSDKTIFSSSAVTNITLSFLAIGLFLAVGLNTSAQTLWDNGGTGNDWQNLQNWEGDNLPSVQAVFGEADGTDGDGNGTFQTGPRGIDFVLDETLTTGVELETDATGDFTITGTGPELLTLTGSPLIENKDQGSSASGLIFQDMTIAPQDDLLLSTEGIATNPGGDITVDGIAQNDVDIVSDPGTGSIITISGNVTASGTFSQSFTAAGDGDTVVQDTMQHFGETLVGDGTGESSDLLLEGSASLVNTPQVTVDGAGSGAELQVDNIGDSINDNATVTLESTGDTLDVNGTEAIDSLTISNGANADISGSLSIGNNGGSSTLDGSVTVDGGLTAAGGTTQLNGGATGTGTIRSSGTGNLQLNSDVGGSVDLFLFGDSSTAVNTALSTTGSADVADSSKLVLNASGALNSVGSGDEVHTVSGSNNPGTAEIEINASEAIDNDSVVELSTANDLLDVNASETISGLNVASSSATVDIASGNTLSINNGGGTSSVTGNVVKQGNLEVLDGTATFNGVISGSGNSDLVISGGTTTLAAANTFTGPVYVNDSGTLELSDQDALQNVGEVTTGQNNNSGTAEVTVNAVGPFDLGTNISLGSDNDILDVNDAAIIDELNTSVTTEVQLEGNELVINSEGGSSTLIGEVNDTAGGGTGGTLIVSAGTTEIVGDITGTANLDVNGGHAAIKGPTTTTGTVSVGNNGSLSLEHENALGGSGVSLETAAVTPSSDDQTALIVINHNGNTIHDDTAVDLNTDNDLLRVNADETIAGINTSTNTTVDINTGNTLTLSSSSSVFGNVVKDGFLVMSGGTHDFNGEISGGGDLIVNGGTTDLDVQNTFTGPTEVNNDGTLNLNATGALSGTTDVSTGNGTSPADQATIRVNASEAINDSATVTLGSANDVFDINDLETINRLTTISGTTVMLESGDTLSLGADGNNSSISGTVTGGGNLEILDGRTEIGGITSFSGDAIVQDAAKLELNTGLALGGVNVVRTEGSASRTAEVELNTVGAINDGGEVALNSADDLFDVNANDVIDELNTISDTFVDLQGGTTLTIGGPAGGTSVIDGQIDGPGNLTVNNGRVTINSDNDNSTYSGTTTLNDPSTLVIGNNGALGTGPLEINGGILTADANDREIDNKVNVNGDFQVGESGAGTFTFNDDEPIDINTGGGTATIEVFDVTTNDDPDTIVDSTLRAAPNETIEKEGSGRLKLNANSSSTQEGDWLIDQGTVEVTHEGALGRNTLNTIDVELSGGTLDTNISGLPTMLQSFDVTAASTIDTTQSVRIRGEVQGGSTLTKDGSAELILAGPNDGSGSKPSFTGGITLINGDIEIEHEEALGGTSSTLTMNDSGSDLEIDVLGVPDIDNTLDADDDFDIEVFHQTEISGAFTGSGNIDRNNGSAYLELSGSSTTYSGTFDLFSGVTEISGTLGDGSFGVTAGPEGDVDVETGSAALIGEGTIGGDLEVDAGFHSPGEGDATNNIGVMTVNEDFEHDGGTTVVHRDPSSSGFLNNPGTGHDQTVIGVEFDNDGGTIRLEDENVSSTGVFYPDGVRIAAFDVGGSVTGTPDVVAPDDNLVDWTLDMSGADRGDLVSDRQEYGAVSAGLTDNQEAVGNGLDALASATPAGAPGTTGGQTAETTADQSFLLTLDALGQSAQTGGPAADQAYQNAIDSLSPQRYSAVPRSHRRVTQSILSKKSGYLSERRGTNLGMTMSSMKIQSPTRQMEQAEQIGEKRVPVAHAQEQDHRYNGFVRGFATSADDNSNDDRVAYDGFSSGAVMGVDYEFTDQLIGGVSFAYARTDVDYGGMGGRVQPETMRIGPYASWNPEGGNVLGPLHLNGSISFGHHDNNSERNTMLGTAEANFDAQDVAVDVTAGYDIMDHKEDLTVEPSLGARYVYYDQESYTEEGAGSANLAIDSQSSDSLESRLGGRVAKKVEYAGIELIPSLTAAWRREFCEGNDNIDAKFTGANGGFEIERGDLEENAWELGTGLKAKVREDVSVFGSYTGLFYEDTDVHSFGAGVSVSF